VTEKVKGEVGRVPVANLSILFLVGISGEREKYISLRHTMKGIEGVRKTSIGNGGTAERRPKRNTMPG